jgi:hypothetical protein
MDIEKLEKLCLTTDNVNIVEQHIDDLDNNCWLNLCQNTNKNIINFVEQHVDKINEECWENLCQNIENQYIFNFIKKNKDKLHDNCWCTLCQNTNKNIINFIEQHKDKLVECCDELLSLNPSAVEMLEKNMELISWSDLAENPNNKVIKIIENNIDKYEDDECTWLRLYRDERFFHMFEDDAKHQFIDWTELFANEKALKIIEKRLNNDRLNYDEENAKKNIIEERIFEENKNFYKELYDDENAEELTDISELPYHYRMEIYDFNCDIFDEYEGKAFCQNKHAGYLIEKYLIDDGYCVANFNTDDTKFLTKNEHTFDFLKKYPRFIDWSVITSNIHHEQLLYVHIELNKYSLYELYQQNDTFVIKILQNHLYKLDFDNWGKFCMSNLEGYKYTINNFNDIEKHNLKKHKVLNEYDTEHIKQTKHDINKDFTEWVWKPDNRDKWYEWKLTTN